MRILLLLLISLIGSSHCQIPKIGKCKPRTSLGTVEMKKLTGTWYEIERSANIPEWEYDCIKANVEQFYEGSSPITLTSWNRYTKRESVNKQELKLEDKVPNSFTLHNIDEIPEKDLSTPVHQILATDNANWLLLRSCQDLGRAHILHAENIWIFSRDRTLSEDSAKSVHKVLQKFNIERNLLFPTNQDCTH